MCRYAFKKYKPHYVCFDCRKTFKQPLLEDIIKQNGDLKSYDQAYTNYDSEKAKQFRLNNKALIERFETQYRNKRYKCPDCSQEMFNIGLDFKAPKKDKVKEWELIRSMYRVGRTFHSCGCNGPGYIPTNLAAYLDELKQMESNYLSNLHKSSDMTPLQERAKHKTYWAEKLKTVQLEINNLQNQK